MVNHSLDVRQVHLPRRKCLRSVEGGMRTFEAAVWVMATQRSCLRKVRPAGVLPPGERSWVGFWCVVSGRGRRGDASSARGNRQIVSAGIFRKTSLQQRPARGRRISTSSPVPGRFRAVTVPPCRVMIRSVMARPIPVPPLCRSRACATR